MPAKRRSVVLAAVALSTAIVALVAGCAVPERIQGGTPSSISVSAPQKTRLALEKKTALSNALLERLTSTERPGCSAAVAVRGELVWSGARGLANLASGTPVTTSTRFDIASISKQFTATAILLLQRDGLLAVDDPVSRHVGGLPAWADAVTIDDLLHHTARLPDFWIELDDIGIGFNDSANQSTTLAAIAREPNLEPGEGYSYSNSHYVLLAEVVKSVSGQALPVFLAERVFGPLDLDMEVAPGLREADVARSYEVDLSPQIPGWTSYGHSGVITTPTELALWGDQYRLGDLIGDEVTAGAVADDEGEQYGAGIRIEADGDLYHSGRWGGYISDFSVSADRETVIVVSCNGRGADRFGIADGLEQIWRPSSNDE